jgi:peroxiredoxin
VLVYAGLLVALLLTWRLTRQSADLRSQLARTRISVLQPHVGMPVPAFRTSTVSGDSITLGGDDGPRQLLFFLSTSCGFCLESLEGWKRIGEVIARDSTSSVEVLWVSLSSADSTKEYVERHGIRQPVLLMNDRKMAGFYHANLVSLTVLLNDSGVVSYARLRAVEGEAAVDSILSATLAHTNVALQETQRSFESAPAPIR